MIQVAVKFVIQMCSKLANFFASIGQLARESKLPTCVINDHIHVIIGVVFFRPLESTT